MDSSDTLKAQGDIIWSIANLLRGPYRPPQYRRVMIPLTVLRRLDCVLEPTKVDIKPLLKLVRGHCQEWLAAEVLPYRPDAWIDYTKTKVGYEIPFNRHFYEYEPPRPLEQIESDIEKLEKEIISMLREVTK